MSLTGEPIRYSIRIFRGTAPGFQPQAAPTSWNNIVQTGGSAGTSLSSNLILTHLVDRGARRLRNSGGPLPVGALQDPCSATGATLLSTQRSYLPNPQEALDSSSGLTPANPR